MKVLLASENVFYPSGGAEHSLLAYVESTIPPEAEIHIICIAQDREPLPYLSKFQNARVTLLPVRFSIFRKLLPVAFCQLFLLLYLRTFASAVANAECIYTQNRWAPYICLLNRITARRSRELCANASVFIRDEKCLGIFKTYQSGLKKAAWYLKLFVEFPFLRLHVAAQKTAYRRANVIFNSTFMQRLAVERGYIFTKTEQKLPQVPKFDTTAIVQQLNGMDPIYESLHFNRSRNVVMVGGEVVKGVKDFLLISKSFPNSNFIIFTKGVSEPEIQGNVHFLPWSNVLGLPYVLANVVLVPSRWIEAFGRVALEAQQFGAWIIVSDQGGLSEAVQGYEKGYVAYKRADYIKILKDLKLK